MYKRQLLQGTFYVVAYDYAMNQCAYRVTLPENAVTRITLDQTAVTLPQKGYVQLNATVTPDDATDQNLVWSSSDSSVAEVRGGIVAAKAPGTATITVTTADGSQSAACTVNVATPLPEPPKEKLGLRSIYQDKGETINEFSAKVGSTVQMRVDGTEQTVTWTIEDTKICLLYTSDAADE